MQTETYLPVFRPLPGLGGGHRQTLAGTWWPGVLRPEQATIRRVDLLDGDALVLHDDAPADWVIGGRTAILLHGLAGCFRSPYLVRTAEKLNARGIRTFRMDLRGNGAGFGLAIKPYHAGCSEDLLAAVRHVEALCPGSPIALIGFSLGGNIVLKTVGESPQQLPASISRAMAVNPPIDLARCTHGLTRWPLTRYDRYFVRLLLRRLESLSQVRTDWEPYRFDQPPTRLIDFDDQYTAPRSGFLNAADYYERCSSEQFLPAIQVPTLLLTSRDDPMIPPELFRRARLSPNCRLHIAHGGGHLGYLGRGSVDPDGRWLDWRVVDWVLANCSSRGAE